MADREEIRAGIVAGWSDRRIAEAIGKAATTVGREVARNGGRKTYRAVAAQQRADELARRPKVFKLVTEPGLAARVTELLGQKYSPQMCSRILEREQMPISAETIYRACYTPGRGLGPETWKHLPRRRQRRKHAGRKWGFASGNPLGEPVSIHQRHPIVNPRVQPGHLEGDLLCGANNKSAVITMCERVSRHTWIQALPNGYNTLEVAAGLCELLDQIPPQMRRSLTWDQGREMKYWAEVQADTGTLIYFCDPRSPWQRPTIENTNGILRRWLPKGAHLNLYTQTDLDGIAHLINHMPRQIHNWAPAIDIYHAHLAATTT